MWGNWPAAVYKSSMISHIFGKDGEHRARYKLPPMVTCKMLICLTSKMLVLILSGFSGVRPVNPINKIRQ